MSSRLVRQSWNTEHTTCKRHGYHCQSVKPTVASCGTERSQAWLDTHVGCVPDPVRSPSPTMCGFRFTHSKTLKQIVQLWRRAKEQWPFDPNAAVLESRARLQLHKLLKPSIQMSCCMCCIFSKSLQCTPTKKKHTDSKPSTRSCDT